MLNISKKLVEITNDSLHNIQFRKNIVKEEMVAIITASGINFFLGQDILLIYLLIF